MEPNCGTWATGSTSKFGVTYKEIVDYFGNIGWTLTHTHDYLDIDFYLSTGYVRPAFTTKLTDNAYEACSGACFKWYAEYAKTEHKAREWTEEEGSKEMFPLNEWDFNPSIWETGSFDPESGKLVTGQYGFGGWQYSEPLDLSPYKYVVVQLKQAAPNSGDWSASFRLFCNNSYWTSPYSTNCGGKQTIVVPLEGQKNEDGTTFDPSHVYIAGFWTLGGESNAIYIDKLFVSNDGITPATGIEAIYTAPETNNSYFDLLGRKVQNLEKGRIYIQNGKKIMVR